MPDGSLMYERCVSFVKSRVPTQTSAAKHGSSDGRFQYFGATITAQVISGQLHVARMANVAGVVSRVAAQYADRRQQVILYNIDPVVYHFHLHRLTSLSITIDGLATS